MDDELLAGAAPLIGVVLAGEREGLDDAGAVDRFGDLVGVLLDDREQVGEQRALDRGQVLRDLGGQCAVGVVGPVDRTVARDRDRRIRRTTSDGRGAVLLLGLGQAAFRIVSGVRNWSPSSSLRW
jgi:hypothetical protein